MTADKIITASEPASGAPGSQTLKQHYDQAIALLDEKAELATRFTQWRDEVRRDGLAARAILKLAREQLRDAAQRRRAADQAEVEELYRRGLGLPLFDHVEGMAQ